MKLFTTQNARFSAGPPRSAPRSMRPVSGALQGGSRGLLGLLRLPRVEQGLLAPVPGPLELVLSDDHAVALAGAGVVERLLDAAHRQNAREPLETLEVVPVGHLHETLERGALHDERVGGVDDLEIVQALAVRGARDAPRRRRRRLRLVIGRRQSAPDFFDGVHELFHALALERGDDVRVDVPLLLEELLKNQRALGSLVADVHFVQRHELGLLANLFVEEEDLVADGVVLVQHVL
mmetsp:Transcript_4687/g.19958  ORF Transcript_4687/g.19958 Transcript_4687/m.19958 type:complete len:236 (+) Transcript_4687:2064-2771(+)